MKRHVLRLPGNLPVYADYDQSACVLTANTADVQRARKELLGVLAGLPIPGWIKPIISMTFSSLLPDVVTDTKERGWGFINARVTPDIVQVSFRMEPIHFARHLLKYEAPTA